MTRASSPRSGSRRPRTSRKPRPRPPGPSRSRGTCRCTRAPRRAISTFRWASEVLRHGEDELMRLDTEASLGSRVGVVRRFPFGPVLGITPFNFPLNLVAHKVAPALGVGAPIVVKPAHVTPIGALRLAEFFAETDLPKGMYQVLPVSSKVADGMARDGR